MRSQEQVFLEDAMLFSTLDTTTRSLRLADTQEILLSDTVGFIRKLPHHLVEAFKSTLEEAKYADIIIHVVDASNPHQDTQMFVVYETLRQLGAEGKPVITVFNKQDKLETPGYFRDFHAEYSIPVSAKTGQGLEELKEALLEILRRDQVYIERLYSFAEAGKIQLIRTQGQLLSEEYVPDGIEVKAYVPKEIWGKKCKTFPYPHTSWAISFTSASFAHCSSSVSLLPISQDANPHCGLK